MVKVQTGKRYLSSTLIWRSVGGQIFFSASRLYFKNTISYQ